MWKKSEVVQRITSFICLTQNCICLFLPQVEPFYVTLSLFDIQNGRRISSDFHVDLNHPSVRGMVPNNTSQYINGGGDTHPEGQRLVHGVPEAAMQYPRQVSEVKIQKKCFKTKMLTINVLCEILMYNRYNAYYVHYLSLAC